MLHLQRAIQRINKALLSVGALAEESVVAATQAVLDRDVKLAQSVIDGDTAIDHAEVELEELCLEALALHQPVAHDLRFMVAALKINNDLERIGDLAVNVAEQAIFLAGEAKVLAIPFDLKGMAQRVESMVHQALDAFVNLDVDKAQAVRDLDDEVDAMHRETYRKVEDAIRNNPSELEQMIHFLNISRQMERIADHATNIAKDVLYLAKGEIVRHRAARKQEKIERAKQGAKS